MFDYEGLDAGAAAALVAESYRELVLEECRLLVLAAHWADLHGCVESVDSDGGPARERLRQLGGVGTPWVAEFAAAELGALQQTTTGAAARLMADALDLRHRLPRVWRRVLAGDVRVWQARKVAAATRHLSAEAAGRVDSAVAPFLVVLPWARFEPLLEARIVEADPADAEQQRRLWEAERFVRTGRTCRFGVKLLVARANAGDVIWFMAMVNRIADLLLLDGDADSADVRRSKAIGILAQPAVALQLLTAHQHDLDSRDLDEPGTAAAAVGHHLDGEPNTHRSLLLPAKSPHTSRPAEGLLDRVVRIDPGRLRPPAVLYVHVSEESFTRDQAGVARFEGVGPVTVGQARRFLGDHCTVTIQPVIDVANERTADRYEIPIRLREAVRLRTPADVFPWGTTLSRGTDLDHTIAYQPLDRGGGPGQTSLSTLGPLSRAHHRVKTHSRWRVRQPSPGTYLWRAPHGHLYLVTAAGTQPLGHTPFAQAVWPAAAAKAVGKEDSGKEVSKKRVTTAA